MEEKIIMEDPRNWRFVEETPGKKGFNHEVQVNFQQTKLEMNLI